ncbi:hypothetical protein OGH69_04515 [Flavobacterium sp. MFBS3-15]|uniref:hypothetical protein n=1 Tax=Flavobacterium sp. MFBS3-15 TaxID=2989816 RepID=UPI0022369E4A|nr:hypothetical protein [Flavobacterium sp. MFBS3-15]MCW4468221.1 hypothetical protein [Flavobacterium sp. MFBS3-15]
MKKTILLFGLTLAMSLTACSDDDTSTNQPAGNNKVLLLKVDLLTNTFEGGKELSFEEADTFTITPEYVSPADFGSIKLKYEETGETIFDGTIHWNGLGEMSYPAALDAPSSFAVMDNEIAMPASSDIVHVEYGDGETGFPFLTIDHEAIWESISHLQLVEDYRARNPNAKVNIFLYAPSVGIGDPADWDWFVILKN